MGKKLNLSQYHRAPAITETRVFTDKLQPGAQIEITIRAVPEHNTAMKVKELAQKHVFEYVTAPPGERIAPPNVDGQPVEITAALCAEAAVIHVMQSPADGDEPYTFDELLILSVTWANAFGAIKDFAEQVLSKAAGGASDDIPPD